MFSALETVQWADVMGLVGVLLSIGAYFALQAGFIKGEGYLYASLQTLGAICLLLSLAHDFNLSSAIIQVTYIAIGGFGMARFYYLTHRIQFTVEEQIFLDAAVPHLEKLPARQLLDQGTWERLPPGTLLTEEGHSLSHLFFLLDGELEVHIAGKRVTQLGPKSMIGEMSCLTGQPTSATVRVTGTAYVFKIEVARLTAFLARNASARHELERCFTRQISLNLIRANRAFTESQQAL